MDWGFLHRKESFHQQYSIRLIKQLENLIKLHVWKSGNLPCVEDKPFSFMHLWAEQRSCEHSGFSRFPSLLHFSFSAQDVMTLMQIVICFNQINIQDLTYMGALSTQLKSYKWWKHQLRPWHRDCYSSWFLHRTMASQVLPRCTSKHAHALPWSCTSSWHPKCHGNRMGAAASAGSFSYWWGLCCRCSLVCPLKF